MAADFLSELPLEQRVALSYQRGAAREASLTLLALDNRLARAVRQAGEPVIAQMKLAWWRDRLGQTPALWPQGEPLLDRLRNWPDSPATLVALVDGWEALLAETLDLGVLDEFSRGRARAWRSLAEGIGAGRAEAVECAAVQWALADLSLKLGASEEASSARTHLGEVADPGPLPGALRSLAVLRGLALRAVDRGSREVLDGPRALLAALRIGLAGR